MKEKMVRFLNSIGLTNTYDYDMDFEMVSRDLFNPEKWNMVIRKDTPWEYYRLQEFQQALNNIKYEAHFIFYYANRPSEQDLLNLLDDWYRSIYHAPHNLVSTFIDEGVLKFVFENEEEKESYITVIKDFKDFLSFIGYEFVINHCVDKELYNSLRPQEIIEPKKEPTGDLDDEDTWTFEGEEEPSSIENEEDNLQENVPETIQDIEAKHQEVIENDQDILLDMMKANALELKKERERQKLNKRGNYKIVDMIDTITTNSGSVDFTGRCFALEIKEFNGVKRLKVGVGDDFGGAITVNIKQNASLSDDTISHLKGNNVRVRGVAHFDEFAKSLAIHGHFIDLLPPDEILPDEAEIKRVELHLHTNMSTQDGVCPMSKFANYAKALGHTAMAVTDHGNVQGFPDAQKAGKDTGIKMLYGCEFYMVDDELHYIKNASEDILNKANYVVLDLETTGLSARYNRIIEFGAVRVEGGSVVSRLDILINPEVKIPEKIVRITNITDDMVKNEPTIKEVFPKILDYLKDAIIVTHNADFDYSFLDEASVMLGYGHLNNPVIDTLSLSRYLFPTNNRHSLGTLCRMFGVNYDEESAHRADYDAEVLNDVWQPVLAKITKDNKNLRHSDLGKLETPKELYRHMRPLHMIALVKNKAGLRDLNRLVSLANVDYLSNLPKIPKKEIQNLRDNLLIGSACFNGEVHRTARNYNKETLKEVMKFYDYIEVQPPENYSYLVNMGDIEQEDVEQYIKDIIEAANEIGKPVVATGDVHYVTRREKVFRDVYISAKAVGGVNHPLMPYSRTKMAPFENPDQHYRTTKEMLDCFSFLDEETAYEIVVKNTNMIADMIESVLPVPNDHLYTPNIENVDNLLRDLCYNTAHTMYGEVLPEYIKTRLETELNGIISHGYAIIYYIAHQLVKKANDDGYIVGSRGSVGSSFVATMSGITEVNPLPPHYYCPHCHHFEWSKEEYPGIKNGYDLPEKVCPKCGENMKHDGQDIPFETFLGFSADKTPDIDLNFPGDYQATAHEYTKVLLGENNVFRAGTIETVAEKTAFGFARGYIERKLQSELHISEEEAKIKVNSYPKAKIEYLASGCVDVKRTSGQHPGGIVVIPNDHEVFDFTPIQYPADEPNSAWRTTHFDYNAIHDTVLKLDMLGHVDPMALKMMCDLTNINLKDIPLNDKNVLSLFSSGKALKLHRDYLEQKTGALGIPEFGTDFVRGILENTSPTTFNDLVIISGLSHGTNVWNGNAENLIKEGTATLQEVIGCRDDIMTYLISMGVPAATSFKIMEDVRKGRKVKPEYEEIMRKNNVPDYYIKSCNLIKYMFPKGHAVAYVTMAVRVGYFKVYHPLQYYATFFTVRSKQYDIKAMVGGEEAIINRLDELKLKSRNKAEKMLPKEEEQLKTLRIAIEMVQRGYKFSNIDLYRSDATRFVVDEENKALIPPFITLDGLGENNAITVVEARKEGDFLSKEDLQRRTKLTSTNIKDLTDLGVLDGLGDSDQMSLFDFI